MNFSEAKQVVQQVKNRYQAFEKLEEVLTTAASLENAIKHMEDTNAKLRIENESLQKQTETFLADHEAAVKRAKEASAKVNRESSEKMKALQQKERQVVAELERNKSVVKASLDELKSLHATEVQVYNKKIEELTATEERLRKSIANLKAKVEKVEV